MLWEEQFEATQTAIRELLADLSIAKANEETLEIARSRCEAWCKDHLPTFMVYKVNYTDWHRMSGPWIRVPDTAEATLDVAFRERDLEFPTSIHASVLRPPLRHSKKVLSDSSFG